MSGPEKRQVPRIHLKQVIAFGNDRTIELVEIADISAEGIAFFSKSNVEKGSTVFLIFPGNDQITENELAVTILNCNPADNPSQPFKVSAIFMDANLKYLEDIRRLYQDNPS